MPKNETGSPAPTSAAKLGWMRAPTAMSARNGLAPNFFAEEKAMERGMK